MANLSTEATLSGTPELRKNDNGEFVTCNVLRRWEEMDRSIGARVEKSGFFTLLVFDRAMQDALLGCDKGQRIHVTGAMQSRTRTAEGRTYNNITMIVEALRVAPVAEDSRGVDFDPLAVQQPAQLRTA